MAITTSEARRDLFGLIERVNLDQTEVEITSKRGSAVLMSKDEYDSLVETAPLVLAEDRPGSKPAGSFLDDPFDSFGESLHEFD